ncbi:hypothetical protein EC988_003226 [Linderina pennispora]|nr:hypothetical protein EC988_003226 [Linderina pennispora]
MVFSALCSEPGNEQLLFEAVDAVLARFGACSAPAVYTIDGTKVAKYLAEQVFVAEQMRPWPATEFLKAMHAAMPPHLTEFIGAPEHWSSKSIPDSIVREMAYVTAGAESQMLHTTHGVTYRSVTLNPLFRSALPHEPRVRMQKLFSVKSKWARSEIVPFLEDLVDVDPGLLASGDGAAEAVLKKTIDGWLIKFGRGMSSPSGEMSGIEYMVFDKDNCLTAPYLDVVHTEFLPAWENCLDVFSRSNVMIVSNSAGTPDDTDDAAACAVEAALGVRVLRHAVKKPGCGPEVIEAFGNVCPGKIAVVGDRLMTDVALANFNGMMGIWTRDIITTKGDNAAAAAIRKAEHWAYRALVRRGVHAPATGTSGNTGQ